MIISNGGDQSIHTSVKEVRGTCPSFKQYVKEPIYLFKK